MKKKECPSCAMMVDRSESECPICSYEFTDSGGGVYRWVAVLLLIVMLLYLLT